MTYVPMYDEHNRRIDPLTCPFGVRDLANNECYSGNGQNRCKYFVKYDWESEHAGCIACTCELPRKDQDGQRYEIDEHGNEQYCFDFGEDFQ